MDELVPLSALATRYGYKPRSLRNTLDRWGVEAKGRAPGKGGESLYNRNEVEAAFERRPRPPRPDLKRPAVEHSHYTMRRAVQLAIDAIDGDYDVDAITNLLIQRHGLVDVDSIDHDEFWALVADHATD